MEKAFICLSLTRRKAEKSLYDVREREMKGGREDNYTASFLEAEI